MTNFNILAPVILTFQRLGFLKLKKYITSHPPITYLFQVYGTIILTPRTKRM